MVLTDRQRTELHAGIYEYLSSQQGDGFQKAAAALAEADPEACQKKSSSNILEKKWTAIPRLQKKVLELERTAAQNAKIHAHRTGSTGADGSITRRMLPRLPCSHTLQGHSGVVVTVQVHPVFTVVVSGSEDGTIKVRLILVVTRARDLCLHCMYSFVSLFTHRFGITKVETMYEHSKVTPIQSIHSISLPLGHTWRRVRPTCPLNCGTLPRMRAFEPCGVTITPFPVFASCQNYKPIIQQQRHPSNNCREALMRNWQPVNTCCRHLVTRRSNCGMWKLDFAIIPYRIIMIGFVV